MERCIPSWWVEASLPSSQTVPGIMAGDPSEFRKRARPTGAAHGGLLISVTLSNQHIRKHCSRGIMGPGLGTKFGLCFSILDKLSHFTEQLSTHLQMRDGSP